jgi:myxalamid-type polyketide synthase MxaE and MxaD
VIALEHPELWGGLIDLDPSAPVDAALVAAEIGRAEGEDQIGYRQGRRYVARLKRSPYALDESGFTALDPEGAYLVTGGLGGLGLELAHWLADRGARHLVLTSRSGLPARTTWGEVSSPSSTAQRIAAVQALEALGLEVTVAQADAADAGQMAALLARLAQMQRPLRGIVHAAGTLAVRPVAELDAAALREAMHAKVEGGWVLHQLTQKMPLDFLVFFSSGAAIWGSAGMAAYAAANHFLDVLAHHRRQLGLPALSVNWGWWADGGITGAQVEQFFAQVGLRPMPAGPALAALEGLLAAGAVQKVVAAVDWEVFKPVYEAKRRRPLLDEFKVRQASAPEAPAERFVQRLKAAAAAEQRGLLLAHVREAVARVLGFDAADQLDVQQGFFKLGMDSIMTVQLRKRLESSLDCSLPSTIAFEYPSVQRLAGYLATHVLALGADGQAAPAPQAELPVPEPAMALDDLSQEDLLALLESELTAVNDLVEGNRR